MPVDCQQPWWINKNDGTLRIGEGFVETLASICASEKYLCELSDVLRSSLLFVPEGRKSRRDEDGGNITNLIEKAALCMNN